jgi:integrase
MGMEVDPIRDLQKIDAMKKALTNVRDKLLFVMGINTALRIGDMLSLRVEDVLDDKGGLSGSVKLKERKTGKSKRFPLNESVKKALSDYLGERETSDIAAPLFLSQKGGALNRVQAWRILKAAAKSVDLENIGAHSMRKTFGYHVYKNTRGNIGLVQKLLNHSESRTTLNYIGINREIMENTYL